MAGANDVVESYAYSSTVRKVLEVNSDGKPLNGVVSSTDIFANLLQKTVTFLPDSTGDIDEITIFTVTGVVGLSIFAVCSKTVTGSGVIEVGTPTSTQALIPQTTGADIVDKEIWLDATPTTTVELTSEIKKYIVTENVQYKISTDKLTDGTVTFYVSWYPISADGNVVVYT